MALVITFEDRDWTFDKTLITVDEWRELKRKYKMTPKVFDESIPEADPDASTFVYWIMLRQSGDTRTPLGDQLKPDIIALNAAIATSLNTDPDEDEEPEPDPTLAGSLPDTGTPPSPGSGKKTSESSATSTSSPSPTTADSEPPM